MNGNINNLIGVTISVETFKAVTGYLSQRPYAEVAGIMQAISQNKGVFAEPPPVDTPPAEGADSSLPAPPAPAEERSDENR